MEKEFTELVNNYKALIFKVCNMYCRYPENCKDLFQEVVLQLWKSFPGFRKEAADSTWIYKVALNTAISNFRREMRRPNQQFIELSDLDIPDISTHADETENSNFLKDAIAGLNQIERAIILLYLDEKTYDEISEIIGISNSNVGVRLNRIKHKLSKTIKPD